MRSTANPAPAAARRNVPYFKSIAFKVSGIAALCFILLGSLMAYISYSQQKALIYGNLTEKEKMFHFPLASEIERIEKAKSELKKDPDAYKKDPDIINLQHEMHRYASIENVENAYLFYPEWLDVDGEKALLNLLSNADLYETEKPAAPYVLDDELLTALQRAEAEGYGTTGVYEDSEGTWISVVSALRDGNGKLVAFAGMDFDHRSIEEALNDRLRMKPPVGSDSAHVASGSGAARHVERPARSRQPLQAVTRRLPAIQEKPFVRPAGSNERLLFIETLIIS